MTTKPLELNPPLRITREELDDFLYGDIFGKNSPVVEKTFCDHSRWFLTYRIIFKCNDRFYETYKDVPATELQEGDSHDPEEIVECPEVVQRTKVTLVYEVAERVPTPDKIIRDAFDACTNDDERWRVVLKYKDDIMLYLDDDSTVGYIMGDEEGNDYKGYDPDIDNRLAFDNYMGCDDGVLSMLDAVGIYAEKV